ncbi:MAG: helix-turn-helix domain-containing protein [Candidatus Pacebacteria bacterium]|nr:helix-turn-helix domain-containing protein [Candidatus Paceibacterota bacterium]
MTYEVSPTLTPAYVDVRGACAFTALSRRTLDYAKDAGELPFIRKGRKILFKVSDLEQWMDEDRLDVTDAVRRMEGGSQ